MNANNEMIPKGWYFCAESKEIKRLKVIQKELFGRKLIFWRSESGRLTVSHSVCPHLGSDLGQLGRVIGENLRCFSHDFTYNGEGDCVATGQKTLPVCNKRVLKCYPVEEVSGFVLVWFDANNCEPDWKIPKEVLSIVSEKFIRSDFVFNVSVETINEDNFDVGHLYKWHKVYDVKTTPVIRNGPVISISHAFKRQSILFNKAFKPPFDFLTKEVNSQYRSTLHGHGLTNSYIHIYNLDIHMQDLIWCTPISANKTMYTTFVRLLESNHQKNWLRRYTAKLIRPLIFRACVWRLRQEHKTEGHGFWERQTRLDFPILTEAEKQLISPYREWCGQFV